MLVRFFVACEIVALITALLMFPSLREKRADTCLAQGDAFLLRADSRAYAWYERAIHHKSRVAGCRLALCRNLGIGVKPSETFVACPMHRENLDLCFVSCKLSVSKLSAKTLQDLQEAGSAPIQYAIAKQYEKGNGVTQSFPDAIAFYQEAAEQGDKQARHALFRLIKDGNWEQGLETIPVAWVMEGAEAFANGRGVSRSPTEAARWYRRAASAGNTEAQLALGRLFINESVKPNSDEEFEQMAQAVAEQGDSLACLKLGIHYGNKFAWQQAEKWMRRAAEQALPEAQVLLGTFYEGGRGVTQSYEEAAKWYRKAADQALPDAQFLLGVLYEKGYGVEQSYAEAAKWYRKAADQAFPEAQVLLGKLYLLGNGVEQSFVEAAKWVRKTAEQGNDTAQWLTGLTYLYGRGVPKSRYMAIEWFRKAARNGNEEARKWLDKEGVGMGE